MRTFLAGLIGCLLTWLASGQEKPKKFNGYLVNAVVAKDAKCMRDYAAALDEGGVKGRKLIADLSDYGCIELLKGVWMAGGDLPARAYSKTTKAYKLFAIWEVEMTKSLSPQLVNSMLDGTDRSFARFDFWVRSDDFFQVSAEVMKGRIADLNK